MKEANFGSNHMKMSWLVRKKNKRGRARMKVIYSLKRLFEYATHRFHEKKKVCKHNKKRDHFSCAAHSQSDALMMESYLMTFQIMD